jgi:UDP-N-acetyl-D-galactosamine dehydrogenase
VATELVKIMLKKELTVKNANVLMLGITFKENCPDIRNTKAIDIFKELKSYHMNIDVYDPWADSAEVVNEFGITLTKKPENGKYTAVILAVAHDEFIKEGVEKFKASDAVIYDVKGILPMDIVDSRL